VVPYDIASMRSARWALPHKGAGALVGLEAVKDLART
jgi:hypothetical protein